MRKGKIALLVRIAVVLALLAGLIGVTAAPAAAITAGFAVTLSNANAGAVSEYLIGPFTTAVLMPVGGSFTITFPSGTVLPATISKSLVTWTGQDASVPAFATSDPDPAVNQTARTVTIVTPAAATAAQRALGAGHTIRISQVAGIINPTTTAATKTLSVASSVEAAATSAAYAITRSVTFTPSTQVQSGTVTVTGVGFTAATAVNLTGGAVTGSGTVNSDGTFTISGSRSSAAAAAITATDGAGLAAASVATVGLTPDLTVTPATGNAQDAISVAGRNFTAGGNVAALANITLGGVAAVAGNVTWVTPAAGFATAFVDRDTDTFLDDFLVTIRIPSGTAAGARTLSITDAAGLAATATITVNGRTLTLSPSSGPVGTIVTLTATGLPASIAAANNTVGIATGGAAVALGAATDTAGGVTALFTIPAATALGARTVTVTVTSPAPGDGAATTATATFTVTGVATTLSLSPTTGPKGTSVVVTGTGLTNGVGSVAIGALTFGGAAWNAAAINVAGSALAASTQTVPAGAAYGANTVVATDVGALTASATFTVAQPTFSIAPTSGTVGTALSITGSGWLPSSVVFLTQNGAVVTSLIANASGAISGSYTVPSTLYPAAGVGGSVLYSANDGATGNTTTTSTFTINAAAISLSATSAAVGSSVTVTGSGFLPLTGVAVTLSGNAMTTTPALPITDAVGSFSAAFTVPGLTGAQTVAATVLAVVRTQPLTVTAAAAAPVTPASTLAPLVTASALNSAYSPNPASPGAFLSYIPNVAGNTLTTVAAYQTVIVNVTVAGQAIPTGYRGQPGTTTLSVGVNFLTYAP